MATAPPSPEDRRGRSTDGAAGRHRAADQAGSVSVGTPRAGADPGRRAPGRPVRRAWYLLLLLPFVGLLWLPFYARRTPELFGFPFFYWYQFAWVLGGAAITGLVYALTTTTDTPPRDLPPSLVIDDRRQTGGRP